MPGVRHLISNQHTECRLEFIVAVRPDEKYTQIDLTVPAISPSGEELTRE